MVERIRSTIDENVPATAGSGSQDSSTSRSAVLTARVRRFGRLSVWSVIRKTGTVGIFLFAGFLTFATMPAVFSLWSEELTVGSTVSTASDFCIDDRYAASHPECIVEEEVIGDCEDDSTNSFLVDPIATGNDSDGGNGDGCVLDDDDSDGDIANQNDDDDDGDEGDNNDDGDNSDEQ